MRSSNSLKRLRALFGVKKAHVSPEPPKLQNLEFLPHTMDFDGIPGISSEEGTPTTMNGSSPASHTSKTIDLPSRQSFANGARFSSPPPPNSDGMRSPSVISSQPGTPTNESAPGWYVTLEFCAAFSYAYRQCADHVLSSRSAAVGRASLGKSGRVIEKLMGENDMHRRDKALAKLQRDEEVKQHESTKAKFEALRVSHDNLQVIHDSDKAAIIRKERKIEELKAELELERTTRKKAEDETKVARRERDEDVEKYKKEALQEQEQRRSANNQYEVLMGSFKGLDQQYKRQVQKIRTDLRAFEKAAAKEQAAVAQLGIIEDQAKKESARQQKINEDLQADFEAHKVRNESFLIGIRERAELNDVSADHALEEVRKLIGDMRHTINVARDMRDSV
ncbi:MAG: hypothetical protein HETSPECPRED_008040 [Heterodermia speciosa]|uniref:SWI5-dependent HO expression protein 3 n=1 Tax=Heterodermia speciosa TaxID=116794 RepID=A0A8H3HYZ4_9LECA|nr:MAG: hypothetical protein HETSPECPRED_008040 [Heterodermia speciosa]